MRTRREFVAISAAGSGRGLLSAVDRFRASRRRWPRDRLQGPGLRLSLRRKRRKQHGRSVRRVRRVPGGARHGAESREGVDPESRRPQPGSGVRPSSGPHGLPVALRAGKAGRRGERRHAGGAPDEVAVLSGSVRPDSLFSHSNQQTQWQSSIVRNQDRLSQTGWEAGRRTP